jgi:hypothetical protein
MTSCRVPKTPLPAFRRTRTLEFAGLRFVQDMSLHGALAWAAIRPSARRRSENGKISSE